MGATNFETTVEIKTTVKDAFWHARSEAQAEYGRRGYTGTIAEKNDFKVVAEMGQVDDGRRRIAMEKVYAGLEDGGCLIDDDSLAGSKWGPAAAITFERDGKRLATFFGWASR